jgi:hypothetical protein
MGLVLVGYQHMSRMLASQGPTGRIISSTSSMAFPKVNSLLAFVRRKTGTQSMTENNIKSSF